MRERGYCYPSLGSTQIVECGPLGTVVKVHNRSGYTLDETRQTCRWVNGFESPLVTMKSREYDPWDPRNRQRARGGWDTQRIGLTPLPDKE